MLDTLTGRPVVLALVLCAMAALAAGCSDGSSGGPGGSTSGPTTAGHTSHLRGSVMAAGMTCADCHAKSGFTVDFSQNPAVQAAGAVFDPVTKTCSNVSCHGNFKFDAIVGANATPVWTDTATITCTSCHGMPPSGHPGAGPASSAASCNGCHSDSVNPDGSINLASGAHLNGKADVTGGSCSACHGDPSRVSSMPGVDPLVASAPPISPAGAPAYAEGAHLLHLNPNPAIAAARPTQCIECHAVPTDATHATVPPAQKVVYGPLATANGANPTWDPGTAGCAASYCHGNFSFNGVTGATTTMIWTSTTRVGCVTCHGMPPTGHPPVTDSTPASCNACHPSTVDPSGAIIQAGTHIDAKADIAGLGCTTCHGDATRVASMAGADPNLVSSPPVATTGANPAVVGAHLGHLNPSAATALMPPMACSECHVVPGNFDHATHPPPQVVVFGTLAKAGGAAPTYVAGSLGCAATYCHGSFNYNGVTGNTGTPLWTDPPFADCTGCHGMPPTGHVALPAPVTASSCAPCHPSAVNADGSINLVAKGHLNGKPDTSALGCAACHGDVNRTTGNLPGTDANLASSPPVAPPAAPAFATGAHLGHVNPTAASFLMAPIACAECHPVPTDSKHATSPPPQRVVFGVLSRMNGAAPTWTATTTGCAATYCHGNFNFNGVRGAVATPLWTGAPFTDCTPCHGMPPTGHLALAAPVTAASCAACHPDTVNTDGTINRTKGAHINGKSEVNNLACTTCHGDATRKPNLVGTDANLTSSPPVAQPGAPAYAVGAHLGHLNPTTASYLMPPIACAECHPVPTDQAHATNPPAQPVVFGTLSRTGGAAPTFNATTSGCAATYCHGNFTLGAVSGNRTALPLWTDGAMTCTSCHGMIPTGHPAYTASGGYTAASCFQCHPQSVNADGTIKQGGGHINGKADGGGCTGCHGDPPRTGSHGDHTRYGCGECHTGYTSAAANATLHQNGVVNLGPSQVGYLCAGKPSTVGCTPLTVPVGSATGPYGTCTNNCHETHTNRRW